MTQRTMLYNTVAFESRCREIGLEILERAREAEPHFWEQAWWQQWIMNLSMKYETLRVQAFRFIDVLPSVLHRDREIARHLREYLDPDRLDMPAALRLLLGYRDPDSLHARTAVSYARRGALMMASSFIAGGNTGEAIRSVERFRSRKMAFTLDVLGEFTSSEQQADRYQHIYLDLIESLCPAASAWPTIPIIDHANDGPMPRVNISIKLTALSPRFDAIDPESSIRSVCARLRPILRRARECDAFINIDMESYAYRGLTLELFMRLLSEDEFRDMINVGIAVQAYLRQGENDYDLLLDWVKRRGHPIAVRLVKGAYWDMETAKAARNNSPAPVWLNKWESDACFERITHSMLENHRWIRPVFASHNVRSLAVVLATAERLGLGPHDYEIQMLNGMGDPLKKAMVDLGQCLRVYTPYGELITGMGYLIRRLLENTANDSFLRQSYKTHDAAGLLVNPRMARLPSGPTRKCHYLDTKQDEPMSAFRNEPIISFIDAADRDRYQAALKNVRGALGARYPLIIDGEPVTTNAWIESINPAVPSEIVGRAAAATTADADHAVAAARRALPEWRNLSLVQRAGRLEAAADLLRKRRFDLAALITLEAGKPWREADADVAEAIDYLAYYAHCARHLAERPRRRDLPGEDNYLVYEPKGVCVVIGTWSFPLALLANMTAAALVMGNTVIMKPASPAPVIAAKLMGAFQEAGLAPGVLNYLPGSGETIGRHLVSHSGVNVISFTGSRAVGTTVLHDAADTPPNQQHIKKVISELGGKNAIIVDDDADIDEAVGGVVTSAFGYSGQKCTACSRVVVLADVYEAFCKRLVEATEQLPMGPADAPGTIVGPVIDAQARDRIRSAVEGARQAGRIILETDPGDLPGGGYYVGPTIIADVEPGVAVAQEEIFGPVLAVIKAVDFDHALEIANDTRYALTGGVYSRSPAHIERCKRDFLVGNLYINRKITGSRVDVEPFGGLKMSGDGAKAGSLDYLYHYCNARTITEHTLRHGLAPAQEVQTKV
ncbi:MAG: proline dehydrogenase family protein [Phycisphaerae bacterium]